MNALFTAVLADPKTWFAILGGAVIWLWSQISKARTENKASQKEHRDCEIRLARIEEREISKDRRIEALEHTCERLSDRLGKELNFGA